MRDILNHDFVLKASEEKVTKDSILHFLEIFGVEAQSRLKKGELFEKLLGCYVNDKASFLNLLSKESVELLLTLDEKNPVILLDMDSIPGMELSYLGVLEEKDNALYTSSLFITSVKEAMKLENSKELIERKNNFDRLFTGIVRFYGIIEYKDFLNIFSTLQGLEVDGNETLYTYSNSLYAQSHISFYSDEKREYLYHSDYRDILSITEDINKKSYLTHKILTKDEYLKYNSRFYFENNENIENLHNFYKKILTDENSVLDKIRFTIYLIQLTGSLGFVLNELTAQDELMDIDTSTFADLVGKVYNSIPHYVLKGYSPDEVKNMKLSTDPIKSVRIGRNDFCPCGSGKKYKKCCGK